MERIIHQIWYDLGHGADIPERYRANIAELRRNHPEWRHRIWRQADGDRFMRTYFGDYYDIYATVPYPIMKIDILRYCLLYHYGGMYVDMDYRIFRNLEGYIATVPPDTQIIINQSRDMLLNRLASKPKVCNSLIICRRARSPLMGELIAEMFRRIPGRRPWFHINFVFKTTGPNLWNDMMDRWPSGAIHILPWEQFNYCNECGVCSASTDKPIYAVHAYDSKWNKSWFLWVRRNIICRPWIVLSFFILAIIAFKLLPIINN